MNHGQTSGFSGTETSGVGITLGLAIILEAIVAWAFLLVVASMAMSLIAIRENTAPRNGQSESNAS